jgi:hypothetical protein
VVDGPPINGFSGRSIGPWLEDLATIATVDG